MIKKMNFGEPTAISRLHLYNDICKSPFEIKFKSKVHDFFEGQFDFGEPTAISRLHLMMAFLYKSPSKIKFISKPPHFFVKQFEFGEPTAISRLHLMMAFLNHLPKSSLKAPGIYIQKVNLGNRLQ